MLLDLGLGLGRNSSPFLPPNLPGLQAWYSADYGVYSDGAAHFTAASSQNLTIASNSTLQVAACDFWISVFSYHDSTPSAHDLVSRYTANAAGSAEYIISAQTQMGFFVMDNGGGMKSVFASNAGNLATSTWYHTLVWFDNTAKLAWISVNNSTPQSVSVPNGIVASSAIFRLGGGNWNGFHDGRLDSVAYGKNPVGGINAVISDIRSTLYGGGTGCTSAGVTSAQKTAWGGVSFYDLNEESGTRYDAWGSNYLTASTTALISGATLNGNFETAGAGETLGSELIGNPGFETAGAGGADVFASWIEATAGTSTVNSEAVVTHGGAKACRLDIDASNSAATVSQLVLTIGQRYRYSFWAKADSGTPSIFAGDLNAAVPVTLSTTYTQYTGTFFATSTVFGFTRNSAASKSIYIDDVSVKQITADDTFGSWTENVAGTSTITDEGTITHGGSHAAKFVYDGSNPPYLVQAAAKRVGDLYSFSLWARSGSGSPILRITDTIQVIAQPTLTTTYAQYSSTYTAQSTNFAIQALSGTSLAQYVDDVVLTDLGPVGIAGIAAGVATDGNFCGQFNGTTQSLSIASNATLNAGTNDFSVSFWFLTTDTAGGFVGKGFAGTNPGWFMFLNAGNVEAYINDSSGGVHVMQATSGVTCNDGQWHFCVTTFDRDGNVTIYIDNVQRGQGAISTRALSADNADPFIIGSYVFSQFLEGRMDAVGFWKGTLLSAGERTALFNNGKGLKSAALAGAGITTPTSYWDLDKKAGITADAFGSNTLTNNNAVTYAQGVDYYEGVVAKWLDRSDNANHATQSTNSKRPALLTSAQNGKPVLRFDGVDDYLSHAITMNGALSVFAVVNANSPSSISAIISKTDGLGKQDFHMEAGRTSNKQSLVWGNAVIATGSANLGSTMSLLAQIRGGSTGAWTYALFKNGVSDGSGSTATNPNGGTAGAIGTDGNAALSQFLTGDIAELIVYNSALSTGNRQQVESYLRSKYALY